MENNTEILEFLAKLDKKVDRLTNTVTKIAKTLHLIPVTEKEERDFQIMQRTNLGIAAKVSADLDALSPKQDTSDTSYLQSFYAEAFSQPEDIFSDVVADDYLAGGVK